MKKIVVFALALTFFASSAAYAGHPGCHKDSEKYVDKKMKMMTKKFDLNESQQGEVETILRDKLEKKKQVKEKMKAEMNTIHEEFKTKMNGVLDAKQQEKFAKKVAKWEKKKNKKKKRFIIF